MLIDMRVLMLLSPELRRAPGSQQVTAINGNAGSLGTQQMLPFWKASFANLAFSECHAVIVLASTMIVAVELPEPIFVMSACSSAVSTRFFKKELAVVMSAQD